MKSPIIFLLLLALLTSGCSAERAGSSAPKADQAPTAGKDSESLRAELPATQLATEARTVAGDSDMRYNFSTAKIPQQNVSLTTVDQNKSINEAADRRIIRNADLTLEVDSTTEAQHRITSISEANGGFVVTSEAKQREHVDPAKRTLDIKLVVRVPSERFGVTLDEIKKLANNLPAENVTGQDVTEDFIDLEARIKTQKALEVQFLEIMKQARGVEAALEVQRQIADVRTEIEKLEGRKRFLENRSSLSTITVNIQTPKMITVSPTVIGHPIRDAVSDSLELGSGILIFFTRSLIMLVPVLLFILLPAALVARYAWRRMKRSQLTTDFNG